MIQIPGPVGRAREDEEEEKNERLAHPASYSSGLRERILVSESGFAYAATVATTLERGEYSMPQYFVSLLHSSDQCPATNTAVRERATKGMPELPRLAQKLGMRFIAGPLVLSAEHESIAVVEADRVETVNEFVLQSGLMQWNSVRISPVKSVEEAMKDLEKAPPAIY
jgi:hypothetical protein